MEQRDPVVLLSFKDGKKLDETTFASYADRYMKLREERFKNLTTSKLRNIYSLIMNIHTKINEPDDFEKHKSDIQYLKVKMAYEAGREPEVRNFLDTTHLMIAIDWIKSYEQFQLYCRYAESLVAYFKFYGGRD